MKNILLLTLANFEDINKRGIYPDLVKTLADKCDVFVVSPREKRTKLKTELSIYGNIKTLKVQTGNITKCGFIEKGISTLLIEKQYLNAINKYFKDIKFDMVMYSTPPITFGKVIKHFKIKHQSISYLILKDIFPQNAVDIGLIKKNGFLHKYFRKKEKQLYELSDYIGCMSPANIKYILDHNPSLDKNKIEVFPNAIIPIEKKEKSEKDVDLLNRYKIPADSVLFVYGVNLGKPQGIDFLLEVVSNFHRVKKGFLLIVGSGTEYNKLKSHFNTVKPSNAALFGYLHKNEYDKLLGNTDIGLIFLDKRFTIPNFPSRLTAYMESSMPILAATDKNTDIKDVIKNSENGLWSESGDIESFISNANKLADNEELRTKMSTNSRRYLEENYDVRKTVEIILGKI
ncbi:MAG: glycosyltransferase family 4 protein [Candidatus Delongbacteria bacterium]|jgi:glycosyltransferase involved in cell wall biosynthesis|nr:glycosyltransferase family 4 protein [Candidatus Delongbacteria bacterium]